MIEHIKTSNSNMKNRNVKTINENVMWIGMIWLVTREMIRRKGCEAEQNLGPHCCIVPSQGSGEDH